MNHSEEKKQYAAQAVLGAIALFLLSSFLACILCSCGGHEAKPVAPRASLSSGGEPKRWERLRENVDRLWERHQREQAEDNEALKIGQAPAAPVRVKSPRPEDQEPVQPSPSVENFLAALERNDLEEGKRLLTCDVLYKVRDLRLLEDSEVLEKIGEYCIGNEEAWLDLFLEHPYWTFNPEEWTPLAAETGPDDSFLEKKVRDALKKHLGDLLEAVRLGDVDKARSLSKKIHPSVYDEKGWTPLIAAVMYGQLDVAKAIFSAAGARMQNQQGDTALHFAAESGNLDYIKSFTLEGAPDMKNATGDTPLLCAFRHNRTEVAKHLLSRRSPTDTVNVAGFTAWHYAIKNKNFELMHLLGESWVNPHVRTSKGTAVEYAIWGLREPDPKVIQCVLENGGNPDSIDKAELAQRIQDAALRREISIVLSNNGAGKKKTGGAGYVLKRDLSRRKKGNGKPYLFRRYIVGWGGTLAREPEDL